MNSILGSSDQEYHLIAIFQSLFSLRMHDENGMLGSSLNTALQLICGFISTNTCFMK